MSEDAVALRPTRFDEFVGQNGVKGRLEVHVAAARAQKRPLPHVMLFGPKGFGKTSLAGIIANELEDPFVAVKMPMTQRAFHRLLRTFAIEEGGILFIDEIHGAPKSVQDDMLYLLEDGYVQTATGERITMPTMNGIPACTVIAATTERDKVIAPLYDRFKIKPDFEPYTPEEMAEIIKSMAARVPGGPVELADDTAIGLGRAASGVPRNGEDLVIAARDLGAAGREVTTESVLEFCRIDPTGLTTQHLQYLGWLHAFGVPTGLTTLSHIMYLHERVLRELERLLIEQGLIVLTKAGRLLTPAGEVRVRQALAPATQVTRRRIDERTADD